MSFGYRANRRKTYRLFISHSWNYSDSYLRMVHLLNEANRFEWHNYSVPQHDPLDANNDAKLRRKLRNQIKRASVVVILSGMYVSHSKWIGEEIDIAENKGKSIIGVRPWGSTNIPSAVADSADETVGWKTSSVVASVRSLSP